MDRPIKIFVSSCESSGDFISDKLVEQLRSQYKDADIRGLGGEFTIFDNSVLAIMGFWEVIPKLPRILWLMHKVLSYINDFKPDIVVTIDSWGFHYPLAKKLRADFGQNIKLCHYVAPMVWVYGPHRAQQASEVFDHMLLILPFEKPYFDVTTLNTTYIGHPFTERNFAKRDPHRNNVVLMPGSRWQEVKMLAPMFREVVKQLPEVNFVIPTFDRFDKYLKDIFLGCSNTQMVTGEQVKADAISRATCAIVKSGTSAVEMLIQKIPVAVVYKTNWINYAIIKRKARVQNVCLINILAKDDVVKELIQDECTVENIKSEILNLLDPLYASKMLEKYASIQLTSNDKKPSELAVSVITNLLS